MVCVCRCGLVFWVASFTVLVFVLVIGSII